jgi:DNA-binding transcriptional LysR family regulator
LLDEPLLVALPAGHRLAGRATVALPALRREGWIVGTASGSPGPIERACQAAGFAPDVVANADDQPTIQALVAGGVAVTLIPRLGTQGAHPGIVFLPVRPAPVVRRLTALTLDLTPRSPATESVLDALSSAAEAAVGLGASSPGRTERSKQTRETARGA